MFIMQRISTLVVCVNGKHPYLFLLFSFIFYGYNQRFADLVACVPSVSARVNALKLEWEQKKKKNKNALKAAFRLALPWD